MAANVVIMEVLRVSDLYVRQVKPAYVPALMREKLISGMVTQSVTFAKLETSEGVLDIPVYPGVDVPLNWSGKAKIIVSMAVQADKIKDFTKISAFFKPDFLYAFKAEQEKTFSVASFDDSVSTPAPAPAPAGQQVDSSGSGSSTRLRLK